MRNATAAAAAAAPFFSSRCNTGVERQSEWTLWQDFMITTIVKKRNLDR